jgi:hypothetical protein
LTRRNPPIKLDLGRFCPFAVLVKPSNLAFGFPTSARVGGLF